jgi:hypothetical protein
LLRFPKEAGLFWLTLSCLNRKRPLGLLKFKRLKVALGQATGGGAKSYRLGSKYEREQSDASRRKRSR